MQNEPRLDSHGRPATLPENAPPGLPGEEQNECRAILDNLPLWICRFRPGGEITYANRACCEYFGKCHADLTGSSFFELIPGKERAAMVEGIAALNRESPTGIREHQVVDPNGNMRWQRWTHRAVFDDEGEVLIYQATGEDITDSKMAEDARLESEAHYRTIFAHTPYGLVITDDKGCYVDLNPTICRMLGYARDELVGLCESKVAALREDQDPESASRQGDQFSEADFRIWRFRRKDGSYLDAEMCKANLPANRILGVIRDLTEDKRYRHMLQQQDRLLQAMGRIAKIGGWEFNPQTGIGGWTEEVARIHDVDSTKGIEVDETLNFYPGESRNRIETALKEAIENHQPYDLELEFVSAKNIHKWVRAIAQPVVENGQVVKMQGTFQDISERKRYEEKLQESQRRLNTLMGNLPGMAYRCKNDMEWTMEYVSKGCHGLTGYSAEELVGNARIAYADIIHHEDRQMVKETVEKSLEANERFQLTYRIVTPSGDQKWVWESGQGILDENGVVVFIEGFINDINNLKTTENALRKSEKLLQETQALARVGGWEMDSATREVTWTDELYKIFGVSPGTHKPGDVSRDLSFFAPESVPIINKAFERAMKLGEPYDLELAFFPAGGERLWVRTIGKPLIKNGKVVRITGNVMDVTARKQAEEKLLAHQKHLEEMIGERTAELQAANKELEAFAYSVSHDLRAPLRAIHGFTTILMEEYIDDLDDEGKRLGAVIQENTRKMGQLIDDLLAFSRMGRSAMKLSRIDMKNMANAIYHEATTPEERRRISFSLADLPDAMADTSMMRQVWMNLISNAVKFSSDRKVVEISIGCEESEKTHTYFVKDNGAGFNMKYKDKLFGIFQRLHSDREFKGTGVGLAIVQRIVHRHGGSVYGEGGIDAGARFSFSLPKENENDGHK